VVDCAKAASECRFHVAGGVGIIALMAIATIMHAMTTSKDFVVFIT
jgi:hypothetical protein